MSPPPVPPSPPLVPLRRSLLTAATTFGAVGVASLPLMLSYPDHLAPYILALAGPVAVALAGEALQLRWLRSLGLITAVLGATAPVLGLGLVLAALAVIGPLGVVTAVGSALRAVDPTVGTAFLSACAIAIAGGFAGAVLSPPIVVGITVLVLVGGTVTTINRLGAISSPTG